MFGIGFAIQMERADRSGIDLADLLRPAAGDPSSVRDRAFRVRLVGRHPGAVCAARVPPDAVPQSIAEGDSAMVGRLYAYGRLLLGALMFVLHSAGVPIPSPPPTTPEELQRIIGVYGTGSYRRDRRAEHQRVAVHGVRAHLLLSARPRSVSVRAVGLARGNHSRSAVEDRHFCAAARSTACGSRLLFNAIAIALNETFHPDPIAPSVLGLSDRVGRHIGVPAGSLFYASTIALLWEKGAVARAPAAVRRGRTNGAEQLSPAEHRLHDALLQLGLRPLRPRRAVCLDLCPTIAIYAAQVVLSVWWLRHLLSGPDGIALAAAHLRSRPLHSPVAPIATLILVDRITGVSQPERDSSRLRGHHATERVAGRSIRLSRACHAPGFTLIAIATLALGIGSAAAIFSVIQNVLLDPAPYSDVDRIAYVQIRDASRSEPGGRTAFQLAEFLDYQEQSQVFEDVIGGGFEDALAHHKVTGRCSLRRASSRRIRFDSSACRRCSGGASSTRTSSPSAPPVFVMSHKMWVAQYSMDPAVVGRTFVLNGVPTTCVGVMPPRFTKQAADLWKPMRLDRADPGATAPLTSSFRRS